MASPLSVHGTAKNADQVKEGVQSGARWRLPHGKRWRCAAAVVAFPPGTEGTRIALFRVHALPWIEFGSVCTSSRNRYGTRGSPHAVTAHHASGGAKKHAAATESATAGHAKLAPHHAAIKKYDAKLPSVRRRSSPSLPSPLQIRRL